jgi:urea transport system ATP-binding protein
MLELEHLTASYSGSKVLFDVSLRAPSGEVTCLIGRNGMGKSTTVRAIMGLVVTPSGDIRVDGQSLMRKPPYARAAVGIGYVPQGREIFPQLTVRENILLGLEGSGKKRGKGDLIPEYVFDTFPVLRDFLRRKGGELSGGQQQQLAIARAIVSEPRLLILDEPTEGIQPSVILDIGRVILKLKERMAIFIVEQYLDFVLKLADTCYGLEKGRVVLEGRPKDLDKRELQTLLSL